MHFTIHHYPSTIYRTIDPYEQNLANTLQAPNAIHLLGTDKYGRDIFSRILIGAQTTIFLHYFSSLYQVFSVL